ncbi:hypothetical protein RsS62_50680 [Rhizobium dioscoreae]|nr:hypothetical protein RsS62_50680 [Rhizobium dioscoreae]
MNFTDTVTVAGTRRTGDGYLVADARIARTGIQTYAGAEIGKPEMPTVRIYRPGGEVFSEDTLKSAAHRPVTNEHPPEMVTSENWKKYAVGEPLRATAGRSDRRGNACSLRRTCQFLPGLRPATANC